VTEILGSWRERPAHKENRKNPIGLGEKSDVKRARGLKIRGNRPVLQNGRGSDHARDMSDMMRIRPESRTYRRTVGTEETHVPLCNVVACTIIVNNYSARNPIVGSTRAALPSGHRARDPATAASRTITPR
jgi:hypothetical protein